MKEYREEYFFHLAVLSLEVVSIFINTHIILMNPKSSREQFLTGTISLEIPS